MTQEGDYTAYLEGQIEAHGRRGDKTTEIALAAALEAFRDTFGMTGSTIAAFLRRPR